MSLAEQLQAWASAASDEELAAEAGEIGATAEAAKVEIDRRQHEFDLEGDAGAAGLPVAAFLLLTDATRLRMALQQMFSVGDVNARMEPRYRHASSVLERTEYLIGPDAPCTGNPRCTCPAHQAYEQWLADDARREQAQQSAEQAREQQPGAIRRVM